MVIYDKENGVLYLPEGNDRVLFDPNEVYERGFRMGYKDGWDKAVEECENKG